jgi:hypothetical protein
VASDRLSGGDAPGTDGPLRCLLPGSLVERIFYGELRLYRGRLSRCKSDHVDYVCSHDEVDMSSGDGMSSSTRVPVARCAWVPRVTSCPV